MPAVVGRTRRLRAERGVAGVITRRTAMRAPSTRDETGKTTILFSVLSAPASLYPETALALQVQQYTPHSPLKPSRCMGLGIKVFCVSCLGACV